MTQAEIKFQASKLRNQFGFSNTEAIRLKSLLLKEQILGYFTALDDDFSGMAIKINQSKFILINSSHTLGRQHFSICHELFHLYIDKNFSPHKCQAALFNRKDKTEFDADSFASYFLLPEDGIYSNIPEEERKKDKIKLSTVIKIEQYYSCSRSALLNRLFSLGFITISKKEEYSIGVQKSAMQLGYSTSLYKPGNKDLILGDYGVLAYELFNNEKISESHYASLMNDIGVDIFSKEEENGD